MSGTGIRRNTVEVLVGQNAVAQGGEGDAANTFLPQDIKQAFLRNSAHHGVAGLMNQHGGAHLPQNTDGSSGLIGIVIVGNTDIQCFAAADNLIQRAHGFFNGGIRIGAVMVENIYIVQMHPLQRLVQTGNQIFPAAPVAIRAGPHIISGLGGNDQFVTVGVPVPIHMDAEIALRLTVRRSIVICQIEMGDTQIETGSQNTLLSVEGGNVAEIVPQTQRNRRKQQAALAAAAIGHLTVTVRIGCIIHKKPTF